MALTSPALAGPSAPTDSPRSVHLLAPLAVIVGVLVVWEASVRVLAVPERFLPSPSRIVWATVTDFPRLLEAARITTVEAVLGLLLGTLVGLALAAAIHLWRIVDRSVYPLLIVSQTIPVVALAPLVIIWFGFGILPKVLLVALYAVFPVAVGTVRGLASAPVEIVDVVRTMGASSTWQLLHLRSFAAAGPFFNGVRVAATYSVAGATVAEFVGGKNGIGIYLVAAKASFRTDLVFAGAFTTAVVTLAVFGVVVLVERTLTPWRKHAA